MRFTAKGDFETLARRVLDSVKRIEEATAAALRNIDENEEIKDEVKQQQRQEVLDGYKRDFAELRKEYGGKADFSAAEIRKLAALVKPPAPNPANVAVLQLLQLSPQPTPQMFLRAAESVGDDLNAQQILLQLAEQHGCSDYVAAQMQGTMQPHKAHLQRADLEGIADGLQESFKRFFDCRSEYECTAERPADKFINSALRADSAADLADIERGSAFRFGGNADLQGEFSALADSAEL